MFFSFSLHWQTYSSTCQMKVTFQLPIWILLHSTLVLSQLHNYPLSPFSTLSRLKGWTRGTHWPLQLTWARNTKSIYLLSSLPHYFSFMKSNPWRNVSHTFTWSVWHIHKAAPWRQSSIIIICGVCIQPTSPYTTLALLLCNSCSSPTPHTLSVTCFQGNTFKNLTSKQKVPPLSPHLSLF